MHLIAVVVVTVAHGHPGTMGIGALHCTCGTLTIYVKTAFNFLRPERANTIVESTRALARFVNVIMQ